MVMQRFKAVVLGFATAAIVAGAALAGPTTVKVWDTDAWGQAGGGDLRGGGPFEVQPIGFGLVQGLGAHGAAADRYLTFCVELDEQLGRGTYDAVLNDGSINGGNSGGNPDPLDARTAFLFTAFIKGTLADKLSNAGFGAFTYGAGVSGTALQEAMWVIEEEIGAGDVTSSLATDILALAADAVDVGGEWEFNGIGDVRILNMSQSGVDRQDILILIPLPIPAAMALVGLLGVGVVSYRRRKLG